MWKVRRSAFLGLFAALALGAFELPAQQQVPHPSSVFGFEPGADYELADVDQLYDFYRQLADASDRVELTEIGETTRGEPMLLLFISTPENLAQIDGWRSMSEELARGRLSDEEARRLAEEGKAIVWIDSGLHSTEVAHSQHAPLLAHHMATDESGESRRIREDVVLLLMPLMNPDGHRVVVDWYRENLGTDWETTSPVQLYHEYVGHDNNRDWFMIRQEETKHTSRVLYSEWYPQIVFNHHQTAPFPARIFIPPFADPVNPHIPPLVVRGVNMVGEAIHKRLEEKSMPGAVSRMTFTMWWNGGMRTVPYFKNMVGILSEVGHASATPQYHDPADLPEYFGSGSHRIHAHEPSVYYSSPWEGGWARLGDAVGYHFESSLATLDIAERLREDWLFNMHRMASDQVQKGEAGGPYAYVVSLEEQWDRGEAVEMLNVLRRGGVEIHRATAPFQAGDREYGAGSYIAYAGQAYRPYLMDLMENQEHPHREQFPGGPPEPPYGGLSGWTLPMQMCVEVARIDDPFEAKVEEVDLAPRPEAVVAGTAGFGYAFSAEENVSRVAVNRLLAQGEVVHVASESFSAEGRSFGPGSFIVEARGDETRGRVEAASRELGADATGVANDSEIELHALRSPRLGIYMPWMPNMDEGWTRWVLNHYEFPFDSLRNDDIRNGLDGFDAVILADQSSSAIFNGHEEGDRPPDFVGGLGEEGVQSLLEFVEGGGTLLAFDGASEFAIEHLDLPVRNPAADLSQEELFIPGSLIRTTVDNEHPVGFGMPEEVAAFFQGSSVFDVLDDSRAEVVARYSDEDLLMSGWEVGADEHLAGKAAVVRVEVGAGEVILIGFRSQFRAQPTGTFKLIFNGIHGSGLVDRPLIGEESGLELEGAGRH